MGVTRTVETVRGPLLCAVCYEAVPKGGGFQYDLTDLKGARRYRVYAFVHKSCDKKFKGSLANPDVELDAGLGLKEERKGSTT